MIEFDAITTLCLACVLYLIGQTIINHVSILRRICIPAPVIGGLLFAILVAILDSFNIVNSEFLYARFLYYNWTGRIIKTIQNWWKSHVDLFHFLWNYGYLSEYYWCITR